MKTAILYFTGTGNTEFVAWELQAALGADNPTELFSIETLGEPRGHEQLASFDLLLFGTPVYAYNAPRFFVNFLRRLPEGQGELCSSAICHSSHTRYPLKWRFKMREDFCRKGAWRQSSWRVARNGRKQSAPSSRLAYR